ncbi:GNAT family N-acetyltransferase [Lamprobacter modestohalophilus]|uniref:GNAT family N-acetyltransferase n=1 Tax=Lamprobacter modestohalophilus TaxID=1064514 RepID=UPI002ADEBFB3|nr:GNAT family N-acetyltransferase [Lamprobacter modestohalophilus]MEA1051622.1 GNAT family N-acetyltransferase [Lamprobacter modestohalophilus]
MNYQDLFQCLKGVGLFDLSSFVLPVPGTGYGLYPINCRAENIDADIVTMLTEARNSNLDSFLTFFTATPERTKKWLAEQVAPDSTRILFAVKDIQSNDLYGYMGLAYGDSDGSRIEGDAIVRYAEKTEPGLMRLAFLRLVEWVRFSLRIGEIWLRVLSDNPAISFYQRCGFVSVSEVPLYELKGSTGDIEALAESPDGDSSSVSSRTLAYMRYSPTE